MPKQIIIAEQHRIGGVHQNTWQEKAMALQGQQGCQNICRIVTAYILTEYFSFRRYLILAQTIIT